MKNFDEAKKRATKVRKKPWYVVDIKNYSIYIWGLPLVPFVLGVEKFKDWCYNRLEWSEEKATKVLDEVLPKVLTYDAEDNAFYYNIDWSFSEFRRYAPFGYKKWASKFGYDLKEFIQDGYENANYTKTVYDDGYHGDTWVKFEEKK